MQTQLSLSTRQVIGVIYCNIDNLCHLFSFDFEYKILVVFFEDYWDCGYTSNFTLSLCIYHLKKKLVTFLYRPGESEEVRCSKNNHGYTSSTWHRSV